MRDIGFEHLRVSAFDGHPSVFGLVPEPFDAVEFGAVWEQEVQGQPLFLEQINEGTNAFCGVD